MMIKNKQLSIILAVGLVLLLAACSGNTPAEPTLSPDAIYTAAAATVQAELATKAALNPTATSTPEPLPTNTLPAVNPTAGTVPLGGTPGAPLSSAAAPTAMVGAPTSGVAPLASLTPLPTFTLAAAAPSQLKYELVSQDPLDETIFPVSHGFDAIWTIKNTGTTTWTKEYTLVFFIGERMNPGSTANYYRFRKEVPPGESIDLIADMKTPSKAGTYNSWWKLKDANGQNFGDVDITIKVQ